MESRQRATAGPTTIVKTLYITRTMIAAMSLPFLLLRHLTDYFAKEMNFTEYAPIQPAPILYALILPALFFVYEDYALFLALGPGGTPSTFLGYLRVTLLRLFALRNPYLPAPIPTDLLPQAGYLTLQHAENLPKRSGVRPKVAGIAPHRQVTQRGTPANFTELSRSIKALADTNSPRLKLGTSCFEKHEIGLFSANPINCTCNGEICHAHPSDGSLHLTLHPADAYIVLERCLGERHPLARGGWFSRFVPSGFLMVYAPRTMEELEAVMEIIKAAVWWVDGRSLEHYE
ncbi:MAG: hypothetical protein M1840_000624 [Geoglossum simile]|nr:MAG: hypothetical protein M1840_000624 [Geoglossum simile]